MDFKKKVELFKKAFEFGSDGYKNGFKCGGAYNKEFLMWLYGKEIGSDGKDTLRLLSEYNKGWNTANLNNWDWESEKEKYPVASGTKVDVTAVDAGGQHTDTTVTAPEPSTIDESMKRKQTPTNKIKCLTEQNKGTGEHTDDLNDKYDDTVSDYFKMYLSN